MTEDSGAFKTNPRICARFGRFVMFPDASFRSYSASLASLSPPIFYERAETIAVFLNQPDSLHPHVRWGCERGLYGGHRVPVGSSAFAIIPPR
jgi:hypothetical protein